MAVLIAPPMLVAPVQKSLPGAGRRDRPIGWVAPIAVTGLTSSAGPNMYWSLMP